MSFPELETMVTYSQTVYTKESVRVWAQALADRLEAVAVDTQWLLAADLVKTFPNATLGQTNLRKLLLVSAGEK